jgi:membrane protease YdiL (CAAX protease family)
MLAGSLMAGLGEEPLFRGLATDPLVLAGLAVLFGVLHHIRWSLWPFTLWAIYEGLLFAAALYGTGNLFVTMVAHGLHDLTGFWIFRAQARRLPERPAA